MLKKLDVIQAQALRLCCGAFKTSPVNALQVEMGEMPLELRRKQIIANYWVHLKSHSESHPSKQVLVDCWEYGKCRKGHSGREPAGKGHADLSSSGTLRCAAHVVLRCRNYKVQIEKKRVHTEEYFGL